MALSECGVTLVHLVATASYFAFKNWGWSITIIIISILLARFKFVAGILSDVINWLGDLVTTFELFSGGIFAFFGGIFVTGLMSFLVGVLWTIFVVTSKAHIVLKIVSVPFAFALGIIYGVIAIPIPLPIGTFLQMSLNGTLTQWTGINEELMANIVCAIPIVLVILAFLGMTFLPSFIPALDAPCAVFNTAVELLRGF